MTLEERQQCIVSSNEILSIDLEKAAAQKYPDQSLQKVLVGDMELPWLLTTLRRAVKQLVAELESESWRILPNGLNVPETNLTDVRSGVALLTKQLEYIVECLGANVDFENWLPEALFLVRYEMHYGFWDRAGVTVHSPDELEIGKAQTEVGLLIQQLNSGLNEANIAYKSLDEQTKLLNEFQVSKENEFTELTESLDALKNSLAAVQEQEKQAAVSNGKISTLLEQSDKTLEASRKKIAHDRKAFNDLETNIRSLSTHFSDQLQELNKQSGNFDELITSAREKEQSIFAQEQEIMRLIGHAADGRLATSFNDREKALSSRVDWWRTASLWVVALAIIWIVAIFFISPIQTPNGINWAIMVANLVRTAPAFILVLFCQSQYTKERNIQEEYAFKSAVSRTVTSYADMIGTGEVNERVKMLVETIQRIYTPPVLGKTVESVSIKSEHIAQAAKSIADTAQNLKSIVADTAQTLKATVVDTVKSAKSDKVE